MTSNKSVKKAVRKAKVQAKQGKNHIHRESIHLKRNQEKTKKTKERKIEIIKTRGSIQPNAVIQNPNSGLVVTINGSGPPRHKEPHPKRPVKTSAEKAMAKRTTGSKQPRKKKS